MGTHLRENGASHVGFMDATQKKGTPKQLRGRSLGTRLSEAEYVQCEKSAARRGQSLSEWCRQVLLEYLEPHNATNRLCGQASREEMADPAQAPEALATLAEVLALRKIVINLLYGDKAGEPLGDERMRELIETADSKKLAKAAERLKALWQSRAEVLSDGASSGRKSSG